MMAEKNPVGSVRGFFYVIFCALVDLSIQQQPVYSDEHITFFRQDVYDPQCGLHGAGGSVVHEDDISVLCLADHFLHHLVRVVCVPIQGIYIPEDGEHGDSAVQAFPPFSERRADVGGVLACDLEYGIGSLCDLAAGFVFGEFVQLYMVKGMVADQMSVLMHAFDNSFIAHDVLPHEEKADLDIPFLKAVQELRCVDRVGAVVESEGEDRLFPVCSGTGVCGSCGADGFPAPGEP